MKVAPTAGDLDVRLVDVLALACTTATFVPQPLRHQLGEARLPIADCLVREDEGLAQP